MKQYFVHAVIVVALVVAAVAFPMVVYSATCAPNPCGDNTLDPCVTARRGTNKEHCDGSCTGSGCSCSRKSTSEYCSCRKPT